MASQLTSRTSDELLATIGKLYWHVPCLLGVLVSGLVIFFPVVRGRGAVRVCGVFVEFGSSLVRVIWHLFVPSSVAVLTYSKWGSFVGWPAFSLILPFTS